MRQEHIITIQDDVIWKAFEAGAHIRSDEVADENARLKQEIARKDALIASLGIIQ